MFIKIVCTLQRCFCLVYSTDGCLTSFYYYYYFKYMNNALRKYNLSVHGQCRHIQLKLLIIRVLLNIEASRIYTVYTSALYILYLII